MEIQVLKDYASMSAMAAARIESLAKRNEPTLLCLAAGDTPRAAYALLASAITTGRLDRELLSIVQLDEWEGMDAEDEGSCTAFLRDAFLIPAGLDHKRVHYFDAKGGDESCAAMEAYIEAEGPIHVAVLGIGSNGHLGLNEPGSPADSPCRVVRIAESTARTGCKYFTTERKLERGVTIGLARLRAARHVVLMASGPTKAEAIRRLMSETPSPDLPVSSLLDHPSCVLFLDEEAAALLSDSGAL
jgi:6-phosphogluconolactonase/glucosamine-6-phosphate isomerase/deaminase